MTTREEECIRIVEELAKSPALRTMVGDERAERILAAVKPKGPFPLAIMEFHFTEHEMDRLVVAWLKHRDIDFYDLATRAVDSNLPDDHPHQVPYASALQSILDNTEAD